MKNIIIVLLVAFLSVSAGVREKKPDTCSIPAKVKQEGGKKKIVMKKRQLYQMIFMI